MQTVAMSMLRSVPDLRMEAQVRKPGSVSPRVCVLFGTLRGDNAQLMTLAEALGWPFEVRGEVDSAPMAVIDRLARNAGIHLHRKKPLLSSLLWPDLILIAGGRRVVDALRIKAMSEGRSRIVCLGRPWSDLDQFDLVITTPQYRLPERSNVLMNALPLNQPSTDALAFAGDEWRQQIDHLPKPWIAVLVGGNSGSCRFTRTTGEELAKKASELARATGGSLLISTSSRTPKAAADALFAGIDVPHFAFRWSKDARRNPHLGFLALAQRFIVTSDSASMAAEAIATGCPVTVFDVPLRKRSRWMTRPRNPGGRIERLRQHLTAKGLWVPARDMAAYHQHLRDHGYVKDDIRPHAPFEMQKPDDLERAVQAIRHLFPGLSMPPTEEPIKRRSSVHGLAIAG